MKPNRRHFLAKLCAGAGVLSAGQLFAAGSNRPRFLLVFLRGGYDAANLLVPTGSEFYFQSRPAIAIAKPSTDVKSALGIDSDWGLHPALRDSVFPLFARKEVAFVPFAGTADLSRSHFETQDSIELGQPLESSRNFRSGFLNRLSQVLQGAGSSAGSSANPMAFTDQLPLIFRGDAQVPNTALKAVGKPSVDARQSKIISEMYGGTPLERTVTEGFTVRDDVLRELAGEMNTANRNAISTKGFELEARRIAKLMKDRFSIGFVDVGGWDTHVGQGGATGYLANRFDELGKGLAGYAQEMGPLWQDTTVVVLSEFGRTFRQNGNGGTDHGHGSVYWVMGGAVRGGRVVGEQVRVDQTSLFQNRDYAVLNDYRALLGGLFARQFGLNAAQLAQVFPGAPARDWGLL